MKLWWMTGMLCLVTIYAAYAQKVQVSIPDTSADVNETILIPLFVNGLTSSDSVISYQFIVTFDPGVLSPNGASSAGTISGGWGPPLVNLQEEGKIIAGSYGANFLLGDGVLVYLKFTAKGAVLDTTTLKFQQFFFNNGEPHVRLKNGVFMVSGDVSQLKFRCNINDSIKWELNGKQRTFPFDTLVVANTTHQIAVPSPQPKAEGVQYTFDQWSDGGEQNRNIVATHDSTLTLYMNKQYRLTILTEPAGVVDIAGSGWYTKDSLVTITAPEAVTKGDSVYAFKQWEVGENQFVDPELRLAMDTVHVATARYIRAYAISGAVHYNGNGLANTLLILSGDDRDTVLTNDTGMYTFPGIPEGNYTITPFREGYAFDPVARSFMPLATTQSAIDFTAADTMAPIIYVTYPNGGELLQAGKEDTIRWEATDNDTIVFVNVHYSANGGKTWRLIYGGVYTGNTLRWNVPANESDSLKIKVTVADNAGNINYDISDDVCSISNETGIEAANQVMPQQFRLLQNYPNPFNNRTVIGYQLSRPSEVKLAIYNMQGQQIRVLVNEHRAAGRYRAVWNGLDAHGNTMPSGIYVYIFQSNEFHQSRKMLYVK